MTSYGVYKSQSHIVSTNVPVKQLLVRPTGGGKTLVFNGISACLKGVTLCISHILSLGADLTRKVMKSAENDDSVSAFHIDEIILEFG